MVTKKVIKDKASIPAMNAIKHTAIKAGIINSNDNKNNITLTPLLDNELSLLRLGVNFSSKKSLHLKKIK